ncbi:Coiled-coil domain-containing protein 77 [Coemansia biformis]|uniref:Coiled-coil domain-containing protein 77 n=1 Tax=Coemansia biformis TaxID=1286918 RepID=A0A9W8CXS6_9FUNG|nr:Coiled-coil domain-containing protein 77 [Coemansia biformis]
MEKEILRLYQERIDKYDEIFREVSRELDRLKVSQRELTEMHWENNRLAADSSQLRADVADLHSSLVKERQNHLEVVAENDRLRIREHELERRVKVLADVSAQYYKEQDIAVGGDDDHELSQPGSPSTSATLRPPKRHRQNTRSGPQAEAAAERGAFERQQLAIDNETLQLSIETMRIQLQEQKTNYAEIVDGLVGELKAYRDASLGESADRRRRTEDLESELTRIKGLYRENLRDLVVARKSALESKHSVRQDNLLLRSEILALQRRLDAEMERSRFLQATSTSTELHHDT